MNYTRAAAASADQLQSLSTGHASAINSVRTASGPGVLDYLGAGLQVGNGIATTRARTQRIA